MEDITGEAVRMEDSTTVTATIIYHYVQDINHMSKSTGTYTTTYANIPGEYTLWPMFRKPENQYPRGIEVLALPFTLSSPGGLYTHTKSLSAATRSPSQATLRTSTTVAAETASPVTEIGSLSTTLAETAASNTVAAASPPHWLLLELPQQAVDTFGLQGILAGVLIAIFLAFSWVQRCRKRARRVHHVDVQHKGERWR